MRSIEELFAAAQKHKGLLDGTEQDILRIRKTLAEKEDELQRTRALHADMDWSYRYLDSLVKSESNRFIKQLEQTLNYGMKTIFDDRDYSVSIIVEDNKRASIHLVYEDEEGNTVSPDVRDSVGGGIKTVIGVLLQIYFIFFFSVEKIIFIDEGLGQLSSDYLPKLFGLLDELAKNNHLKIMLVTHDSRMTMYASRQYVVENHEAKRIDGEAV